MASKSSKESRSSDVDLIRKQLQQGIISDGDLVGRTYNPRYHQLDSGLKTNIRELSENDEYEVYFQGKSTNGALLTGSKTDYHTSGFEKHTRNGTVSKKLPVPKGQYLKFIDAGLQFTIIMTTLNETYLFGDFVYGSTVNEIDVNGRQLKVLLSHDPNYVRIDYFPDDPIAMQCGEQYVAVLDHSKRLWYCGIEKFGTGNHNSTYDFVEIGLREYLNTEFVDEPSNITHFRVGGRHLCFCINNSTIISTGANYYGQLGVIGVPEVTSESSVTKTMAQYKFTKSLWNSNGKFRVRDVACSGNMTAILTECGQLFKTANQNSNGTDSIQKVEFSGFSLRTISGNWTHILAYTTNNQIMAVSDNHIVEYYRETPVKDCENLFISTGTNSNSSYYMHVNNELYSSNEPRPVLTTTLPIVVCKVTSEMTMVLCMNFKSNKSISLMRSKLHQCTTTQGLSDIVIYAQQ